ncbi:radical SAM protein [Streptomyces aurantiacus]|uniref:Radical SAM core domain-containing protein n=1 Tax=Streptomyces aurantiacus TaxID=47760 RepID=A0A7G1NZR9_9ACTN|nr:radical SAM protein [Streptomyces aurantiacus]BCL27140.1 hypothetical protein GCM10017557_19990 [Streptomyces aurantiacus]
MCYAKSGPTRGHGEMSTDDWKRLISDTAEVGVKKVQFTGGQPTLHPEFEALVNRALVLGLTVRVYSNLYRVKLERWELFMRPRVTVATSYYSDDPAEHERVTNRRGSHAATRANIVEALRCGISCRSAPSRSSRGSAPRRHARSCSPSAPTGSSPTGSAASAAARSTSRAPATCAAGVPRAGR